MLATILGPVRYLAGAHLHYVVPIQPADAPPPNVAGGTAAVIRTWESTNDLAGKTGVLQQIIGDVGWSRHFGREIGDSVNLNKVSQGLEVNYDSSELAEFVAATTNDLLGNSCKVVMNLRASDIAHVEVDIGHSDG